MVLSSVDCDTLTANELAEKMCANPRRHQFQFRPYSESSESLARSRVHRNNEWFPRAHARISASPASSYMADVYINAENAEENAEDQRIAAQRQPRQ